MQRKFQLLFKDKATAASDNDRDNVGTRFTFGSQLFSRKYVGSAFSCVLGKKSQHGNCTSKVKKKEIHGGDSGRRKALSQLIAVEESDREVEGKQKRKNMQRVNLPLLGFLDKKKKKKNFMRTRFSNAVIRFWQRGRKVSLRYLVRISSKILVFRLKLKMMKFLVKKKARKQFDQEGDDEENEDRELCKKRILMGGRCRPLNSPGYGTYGFFLPRDSSLT